MSTFTVRHTAADGTLIDGANRGDATWPILRAVDHRWRHSPEVGIYLHGSRDRDADQDLIARTAAALRAAGHTVTLDINNTPRTAAERRADADTRARSRAARLDERAHRADAEATARQAAADAIGDGYPLGQPILQGHHSEPRARRELARMDTHQHASADAAAQARRLAARADGVRSTAAHRHNPRAMARRIDTLSAQVRHYERELTGHERRFRDAAGNVVATDLHEPATGDRAEDLHRWIARDLEEIEHLRTELAELEETGTFTAWTSADFEPGDLVNIAGAWLPVRRVNAKTVTVPFRLAYLEGRDTSHTDRVPYDKIFGRRRDGMQWDSPVRQPWPADLADQVTAWQRLAHRAKLPTSPDDHCHRHVHSATRLVHGLPLDAADWQVNAIAASIIDTDERRALAAAYLAVHRRLTAGETPSDITATLTTITGAPAIALPTDRDPIDARAEDLHTGDLIAGVWGTYGGVAGPRQQLFRTWGGRVTDVGPIRDRRNAAAYVLVTLHDGTTRDLQTHRWLSVYRADHSHAPMTTTTPESNTASPTPPAAATDHNSPTTHPSVPDRPTTR